MLGQPFALKLCAQANPPAQHDAQRAAISVNLAAFNRKAEWPRVQQFCQAAGGRSPQCSFARAGWMVPLALLGALMFAWGLWTYDPYHIAVGRADGQRSSGVSQEYHITLSNKLYHPADLHIRVLGLPSGKYHLDFDEIKMAPGGRESLVLSMAQDLPHGLHPVVLEVSAQNGWTGSYRIQHFSE